MVLLIATDPTAQNTVFLATVSSIVLSAVTTAVTVWLMVRRRKRQDKDSDWKLSSAERELNHKHQKEYRDAVIVHYLHLMKEREDGYNKDIKRMEENIGNIAKQLRRCQREHDNERIKRIRLVSILEGRKLISQEELHSILADEEEADDDSVLSPSES